MLEIICTSCEDFDIKFISWKQFFDHVYDAHPHERCHVTQIPFNISGRNKKQIVEVAEATYLNEYLIY